MDSEIFPDLPTTFDLRWWERFILAFRSATVSRDTLTGAVVAAKRWRGKWYIVGFWPSTQKEQRCRRG